VTHQTHQTFQTSPDVQTCPDVPRRAQTCPDVVRTWYTYKPRRTRRAQTCPRRPDVQTPSWYACQTPARRLPDAGTPQPDAARRSQTPGLKRVQAYYKVCTVRYSTVHERTSQSTVHNALERKRHKRAHVASAVSVACGLWPEAESAVGADGCVPGLPRAGFSRRTIRVARVPHQGAGGAPLALLSHLWLRYTILYRTATHL
jgi:hypothetical protein